LPNRIEFSVIGGREPSRVRLNQNFARGWRSTAGPVTADPEAGQPSVVLAPGQTGKHSFAFVPFGLFLGFGLGLAAVIAMVRGRERKLGPRVALGGWLSDVRGGAERGE
jgi:hypothetical protein